MSLIGGACASNDGPVGLDDTNVSLSPSPAQTLPDVSANTPPSTIATNGSPSVDAAPVPADVAAVLAGAGVTVVDAPEPLVTDSMMTLTTSQAGFMAEEASSGSGLLGGNLDAAGGGATQGLPISAVLAGYVRGVDTPGAQYSRDLLAGQDLTHPEQVVFPTIVLALFATDAASAFAADQVDGEAGSEVGDESTGGSSPPASSGFSGGAFSQSRVVRTGICSDVTKSIFDAVDKIFAKIHIPPGKVGNTGSSFLNGLLQGLTDVVVGGLNFVIDAAKALVVDGIKFVLSQVLSIVAEVAAAAALVANIVSAVRPWRLDVTAKEPNTRKGVDAEQVYDQVTAQAIIVGPTDDWPAWFVDCAAVAGVSLPSLLPVEAPVMWRIDSYVPSADLMTESTHEITKDAKLRKDGKDVLAKIGLVTGTETKEKAEKGAEQHGAVVVTATARRNQIEELRKTMVTAAKNLAGRVLSSVPKIISDFLLKLIEQAAEGSSEQVASLLDASGNTLIDVTYHGPPEPEASLVPTSLPDPAVGPCSTISDSEVLEILGVPIARHEATGAGSGFEGCIIGTARQPLPGMSMADVSYISVSYGPGDLSMFHDGSGEEAPTTPLAGLGDAAELVPDAGAVVVNFSGRVLLVQVVIAGVPASTDVAIHVARLVLDRLG